MAEVSADNAPKAEGTEEEVVVKTGSEDESKPEPDDEEGEGQEEEVEVVLGDEGSQPKAANAEQVGISKRVNKLNRKIAKAKTERDELAEELRAERERRELAELALDQRKEAEREPELVEPNPDDFDGGAYDPEFVKKNREYIIEQNRRVTREELATARKSQSETSQQREEREALLAKQTEYGRKVLALKVKDFDAKEDKVLEIMGQEKVNGIISVMDDPHLLIYYLGTNEAEAHRLTKLLDANPVKGIAEIGRVAGELKVRPKRKSQPEPDKELQGGVPSGSIDSASQKKLSKLLAKASETNKPEDFQKYRDYKKSLRKAG